MRAWLLSIVLGFLAAGAVAYAAVVFTRPPAVTGAAVTEYVPGLKRAPGTYQQATINVATDGLGAPDVTIDIKLAAPAFNPKEIRVKRGQVVKLRLEALDSGLTDIPGVRDAIGLKEFSGHGFQVLGPYDIWVTGLRKGVVKEVVFKATEVGEFPFECTVFCHPYHYLMQGKLIVEE